VTTIVRVDSRGERVWRLEQVMAVGERIGEQQVMEGQVELAVEPWKGSMRGSYGNDIRKNSCGSQRNNTKLNHKSGF